MHCCVVHGQAQLEAAQGKGEGPTEVKAADEEEGAAGSEEEDKDEEVTVISLASAGAFCHGMQGDDMFMKW